jgi:hypothetical protein
MGRRAGLLAAAVMFLFGGFVPAASAAPLGLVSIGGATVVEGGRAAFDITLSEPSNSPVSVRWQTSRDTATPAASGRDRRFCNGDYQETSALATIPAHATEKRVYVQTCPDLTSEPVPERFEIGLNIGSVTGGYDLAPHSVDWGTIIDRPPCGCNIKAQIGDVSVVEGNAGRGRYADFTVTLSQTSNSPVSIDYTVGPDTTPGANSAICGPGRRWVPIDSSSDCDNLGGVTKTLVFPLVLGKTRVSSWIRVPIFPDINAEPDETFTVTLSNARNAGGALVVDRAVGTGTIINDD